MSILYILSQLYILYHIMYLNLDNETLALELFKVWFTERLHKGSFDDGVSTISVIKDFAGWCRYQEIYDDLKPRTIRRFMAELGAPVCAESARRYIRKPGPRLKESFYPGWFIVPQGYKPSSAIASLDIALCVDRDLNVNGTPENTPLNSGADFGDERTQCK